MCRLGEAYLAPPGTTPESTGLALVSRSAIAPWIPGGTGVVIVLYQQNHHNNATWYPRGN
ncbi:hypothetical protein OUZ56_012221 [Daphnia magna]|uniref:Uncharacterized protein n=1 Tax=Daphnia magna TaxID=35525 RepID=A0ABQ9Z2D2_9CRUS|nr:hypothetical protein OUZ56_012221 [Daphnia magna]